MMKNHEIEVFLTEGKVKINETVEALENCCTAMEAPPGMQRAKRVIRERASPLVHASPFAYCSRVTSRAFPKWRACL